MPVADRTPEHIAERLHDLGHGRVIAAQMVIVESEHAYEFPAALMLAIGLRESGLRNINNPKDTDKGVVQLSKHYHLPWLRGQPGCPVGTWRPKAGMNAAMDGYCPRFTPAMTYAFEEIVLPFYRAAAHHKVRRADRLHFAVTAYNTGEGYALEGYRAGNIDLKSTGRDYGAWVLRHVKLIDAWLEDHPTWKATG